MGMGAAIMFSNEIIKTDGLQYQYIMRHSAQDVELFFSLIAT
jgi:hypothetical protein